MENHTKQHADITILEKRTFKLHLISQFFNGFSLGLLLLQDIILKKSLNGSDFDVMILALFISSAFLLSIYGSEIINRSASRAKTIMMFGFAAKCFLLILPLFDSPSFYIFCLVIMAFLDNMMLSSWNIVFKHNYTEKKRSKLYSYAVAVQISMILVVSTIFGNFLDINPNLYKIMFPVAGIFGMITYYNLAKMISMSMDDYSGRNKPAKSKFTLRLFKDILVLPLRDTARIFTQNKPFLRFETFFFLYGVGFMILTPAVPVFLVDGIHLSYSPISFAKGLVFHTTLILFTPLMGKYHGTGNPTKFCGYIFIILSLYPLILISSKYTGALGITLDKTTIVYISHFFFGLAMSGVGIAWSLSSIYFATAGRVANYQAVHITLSGVRGLFAPALGYFIMKVFAIEYTFFLAALLLITGGILMLRENKIHKMKQINKELPFESDPNISL